MKTITIGKSWQIEIIQPLSREGHCLGYVEALPPSSPENDGVFMAVGTATGTMGYIVYKSSWSVQKNEGSWNFIMMASNKGN